jgi:uncharacterized coiled-coil DUF342 family protein
MNLTATVIGIFISVIIIDGIIRQREQLKSARKDFIIELRRPISYLSDIYPMFKKKHVKYLELEIKHLELQWDAYQKLLKPKEKEIVTKIKNHLNQLSERMREFVQYNETIDTWNEVNGEKKTDFEVRIKIIDELLDELDNFLNDFIEAYIMNDNCESLSK